MENTEDEDNVVSLQEVLDEEEYLDDVAERVLGNADAEKCSYTQGYVKRQPLYSCLTCAREFSTGRAGLCLACSLHCHDGHECVELYTKRNFRCDCGNSKFGDKLKCLLEPVKDTVNDLNRYNQNFDGLYCTCHRPYPDSENPDNDNDMIQCIVCEDWFHTEHVGIDGDDELDFDELVCMDCLVKLPFLQGYSISGSCENGDGESKANDPNTSSCKKPVSIPEESPKAKKVLCFAENWRSTLCQCPECLDLYQKMNCEFLLDNDDTLTSYENKAKIAKEFNATTSGENLLGLATSGLGLNETCMKALKKLDRVHQVEMIHGFKDMTSELARFLEKFAAEGKVVKLADIHNFFEQLKASKRRRLNENGDFSSI